MKTLGLIGGIGPESTIDYYRLLLAGYREATGSNPSIVINSVDIKRLLAWMTANELPRVVDYLVTELARLEAAGADFAALAANTPHIVFNEVQERTKLPMISIVEATRDHALSLNLKTLGLFATRFTMQGGFYHEAFSRAGLKLIVPDVADQSYIHDKYINELLNDRFLPETRNGLLAIADRLKAEHGIQGLILGGTELPLILRDKEYNSMPFLDTTRIHVNRLLAELLN